MLDPIRCSAAEAARAVRASTVSSSWLVSSCLERIEAVNGRLNAVVQLAADAALARAREADAALARGEVWGPLHGVPMTIKDSFETEGIVTTSGTTGLRAHVPQRDATVVARLKAAGAIVLGKTNVPELTLRFSTDNHVYGRTNNPYDPSRTPGGSSGGAAAIVAAGGAPFDVGTDAGGSIRIPAHFCGVAGLKATAGRVPRTGHIPFLELGLPEALIQVGPLARRVEDLALLLAILAGPDGVDPTVVPAPLGDFTAVELGRLRIAWYDDNGLEPTPTREAAAAVRDAAAALADQGASVREARPPGVDTAPALWRALMGSDGGAGVRELLRSLGTERMHPFLEWTQQGEDLPSSALGELIARWYRFRSDALSFLRDHDVVLCPVHAAHAPRHEEPTPFRYCYPYNLLGWPVAVVRCGTSAEGLPIGVQVVAHPWREDVALAVASLLEDAFGGWRPPAD